MKDWEWFALGLVPFAGMPVAMIRYFVEDHTPTVGQLAASAVGGQAVAWGIQRAGLYKMNEALMLYRVSQLGFVEEGYAWQKRGGYSLTRGKYVKGVRYGPLRGSGVGWRATAPMRFAAPLMAAGFVGLVANSLRTDSPTHGDRYQAHRSWNQPDFNEYV